MHLVHSLSGAKHGMWGPGPQFYWKGWNEGAGVNFRSYSEGVVQRTGGTWNAKLFQLHDKQLAATTTC